MLRQFILTGCVCMGVSACGGSSDTPNFGQTPASDPVTSAPESNPTVDSQGVEPNTDSQSDQDAASNSHCEVVNTSVTYEDYCSRDINNCVVAEGTYVPIPSGGFGTDGTNICDLSASYGVDEIEALIPYVQSRPDIDGKIELGEWGKASIATSLNYEVKRHNIDNLLVSPVTDYLDGAGYSTWRAMHDGVNLYIHVKSSFDYNGRIFTDSDPSQPWHDDSLELYLDGDNSKMQDYDGIDDFQMLMSASGVSDQPYMSGSSASDLGVFYKTAETNTRAGHTLYEIAINLESAGIQIGKPFGFDIHINEDDNGGDRDAKYGWFEKTGNDRSWMHPKYFGTAVLTGCGDSVSCGRTQVLSQ